MECRRDAVLRVPFIVLPLKGFSRMKIVFAISTHIPSLTFLFLHSTEDRQLRAGTISIPSFYPLFLYSWACHKWS